jgi:uncharacterized membrane protein YdjX (TVP38/TMEM64 family)
MPGSQKAATPPPLSRPSIIRPLIFLLLLIGIFAVVRFFHLQEYLEKERLRQFVASYGMWGPAIYLAIWTLAPPLSLPGLPITLAGGVLFGPFWGVVYTAFGAAAGASLAFLVARYLAQDWVAAKLAGTKLKALDDKVAEQGWKIVAFTRLIPVFPFFIINFAFGLTRITFKAYAVTTFFAMLPLTIAYVYFSSNILDLFQGKVSGGLIVGVVLVALVSLIPFAYKKLRPKQGTPLDFPNNGGEG